MPIETKLVALFIPFILFSQNDFKDKNHKHVCDSLIKYYELDSSFVYSIIQRESRFTPNAVNKRSGAYGYLQVMPSSWQKAHKRANATPHFTPLGSLKIGLWYMDYLKKLAIKKGYKDLNKAIDLGFSKGETYL